MQLTTSNISFDGKIRFVNKAGEALSEVIDAADIHERITNPINIKGARRSYVKIIHQDRYGIANLKFDTDFNPRIERVIDDGIEAAKLSKDTGSVIDIVV